MKRHLFSLFYPSLVAAVMMSSACSHSSEQTTAPRHSVLTTTVMTSGSTSAKSLTGIVNERATVQLGFKTAGQIENVLVKEGQYIKAGQLLATLDTKDYKLQLQATQIQYDQTQREVERLKKLYEGKALPGNDLDKAESGLRQLAVQLQSYKNQLAYTRLMASTSGYVQSVNFHRGEMVNAGTPVVSILCSGQMQVEVNIPINIYQQRSHIRGIRCTLAGKTYAMRLASITPKADNNQLYKALLNFVSATDKQITPGVNMDVEFIMTEQAAIGYHSVPLGSVFEQNGRHCVWVVNADSTLSCREVTVTDMASDGMVVISGGLDGSETIVKAGAHTLQDGERVKIIEQTSQTNVGGLL